MITESQVLHETESPTDGKTVISFMDNAKSIVYNRGGEKVSYLQYTALKLEYQHKTLSLLLYYNTLDNIIRFIAYIVLHLIQ